MALDNGASQTQAGKGRALLNDGEVTTTGYTGRDKRPRKRQGQSVELPSSFLQGSLRDKPGPPSEGKVRGRGGGEREGAGQELWVPSGFSVHSQVSAERADCPTKSPGALYGEGVENVLS